MCLIPRFSLTIKKGEDMKKRSYRNRFTLSYCSRLFFNICPSTVRLSNCRRLIEVLLKHAFW